ncbi:MAG: hypothetical protein HY071_00395 [Chloroflexi bacterium]|nr:hypothetical protein [Chloroflexota bacterium]
MDIQQLRSWIFELYEPLEDQRQYIVFDAERGNLLIDVPRYSERALRLIRGTGRASLLLVTNAVRATQAARYRDALGVAVAAHADDASAIEGGPDITLTDDQQVRPDVRALRVRGAHDAGTVVLLRKSGPVLISGDLDLADPAARALLPLEFSSILSANRAPVWNAGREQLESMQAELPRPKKRFGILLPPPWDRAYLGRLEDKLYPHEPIVPKEETATREAAMGPTTLVVSRVTADKQARAPRPKPDQP